MGYTVTDQAVKLCVVDNGPGFHVNSVSNPIAEQNISREGGRGLFLVRNFVDRLDQNTKGNALFFVKNKKQTS
jgi:serine/threonine-protein kinase RsbW